MAMLKEIGRLDYGLVKIGLPLIIVTKNNLDLFFLVDSGASHNIIRKDVLIYFKVDPEGECIGECQFHRIDAVEHKSFCCSFSFELNGAEHNELFQVLDDGNALDFPIDENTILPVQDIVGVDFLVKFKCLIDFSTFTLKQSA